MIDLGPGMRGFTCTSLYSAEKIVKVQCPKVTATKQVKIYNRRSRFGEKVWSLGIHIYFIDDDGTEYAYYTPIMESLAIWDKPRIVGIQEDAIIKPLS